MRTISKKIPDAKVVLTFNGEEVYEASTEPFKSISPWIHSMRTFDNRCIELVVWNSENNAELVNRVVTPTDIIQAFVTLVEKGCYHCSAYPIQDLDNADACTSDLVLQQAIYGEVIWG